MDEGTTLSEGSCKNREENAEAATLAAQVRASRLLDSLTPTSQRVEERGEEGGNPSSSTDDQAPKHADERQRYVQR